MVQDALGLIDPLVDAVENAVRYFFPKPVDVYCQHCGTDLTRRDVAVSDSGRTYCYQEVDEASRCFARAMFGGLEPGKEIPGLPGIRAGSRIYVKPFRDIQRDIRNGIITKYTRLEETAQAGPRDATSRS